jgi:hypothetical protein
MLYLACLVNAQERDLQELIKPSKTWLQPLSSEQGNYRPGGDKAYSFEQSGEDYQRRDLSFCPQPHVENIAQVEHNSSRLCNSFRERRGV